MIQELQRNKLLNKIVRRSVKGHCSSHSSQVSVNLRIA